jgi:hypothetical protein
MGHNRPVATAFTAARACYTRLQQKAAEPGIDQSTLYLIGGVLQHLVGQALLPCPTDEFKVLQQADTHFSITQ